MPHLTLKPTHTPVKAYYDTLARFGAARFDNEGNIREAFGDLLKRCARQFDWTLVPEYPISRTGKSPLRVDGGLIDAFNLPRAWWETVQPVASISTSRWRRPHSRPVHPLPESRPHRITK